MLKLQSTSQVGIYQVLQMRGRIDSANLESFRQILKENQSEHLAVDLSGVDFLSLPAIQLLVQQSDEFKKERRHFVVVAPIAQVLRHLEVYAARTSLRIFRSFSDFEKGRLPEVKRSEYSVEI